MHKHAKWPPSDLTPWTLTLLKAVVAPEKGSSQKYISISTVRSYLSLKYLSYEIEITIRQT